MKKFFLSILSIVVIGLVTSCSSDEITIQSDKSILSKKEIQDLKFKNKIERDSLNTFSEKSLNNCSAQFYQVHPSFDNSFQLNEPIVISWESLLCGNPPPNKITILYRDLNSNTYRTIVSDLPFNHKTNPNFNYNNFVWYPNSNFLENINYEMILMNSSNGNHLDYHQFTRNGIYTPSNCNIIVNNQIDGDYRVEFTLNNGNHCHSAIRYEVDFGDGTSSIFTSNQNQITFSHQYPFVYSHYNVRIMKYSLFSAETIVPTPLSDTYITVTSKRD